jgi:hypothetical protein
MSLGGGKYQSLNNAVDATVECGYVEESGNRRYKAPALLYRAGGGGC